MNMAAAVEVAEANSNRRGKGNKQSTIKCKKMAAKRTTEVWRRPLADNGNTVMAMVMGTRQQQRQRQWLWLRWLPRQWWRAMAEMRSTALFIMAATAEARATVAAMAAVRAAALVMTAMRAMGTVTAWARVTAAKIVAVRATTLLITAAVAAVMVMAEVRKTVTAATAVVTAATVARIRW